MFQTHSLNNDRMLQVLLPTILEGTLVGRALGSSACDMNQQPSDYGLI